MQGPAPSVAPPRYVFAQDSEKHMSAHAAQMKCVGAEDGQNPCQRCKRTGAEYVSADACHGIPTRRFPGAFSKNIAAAANPAQSQLSLLLVSDVPPYSPQVVRSLQNASSLGKRIERRQAQAVERSFNIPRIPYC